MEPDESIEQFRLSTELRDAQNELARHHVAFKAVSDILDDLFRYGDDEYQQRYALKALKAIRNIVG